MLDWLKFTFGSFILNKYAKEGATRRIWNVVFAMFIMMFIITAFFTTGISYSFTTHYAKASQFQEFSYHLFYDEQINISFKENKEDHKVYADAFYKNDANQKIVIDTFSNKADEKYKYNDYNVIIDTRNSTTTFVDFELRYYSNSQKDTYISFEEYKALENKNGYTGKVIPFNSVVEITDEMIVEYEKYLASNENEEVKKQFEQIKDEYNKIESKTDEDLINYQNKVYDLYTKTYYSLTLSPTNQYYYQYTYAQFDDNGNYVFNDFLIITDNWAMLSFVNDKNGRIVFDGFYDEMSFTELFSIDHPTKEYVTRNVDIMYTTIYSSVNNIRGMVLFMQLFRYCPIILIAMCVLSLFLYCFSKIKKNFFATTYAGYFKVISSFLIGSATLAGIVTLILCFIIIPQTAVGVGMWILLSLLSIRTFIFVILEAVRGKYQISSAPVIVPSSSTTKDENTNESIDLSHIEPSSKIIVNEEADDDDDEKMELM